MTFEVIAKPFRACVYKTSTAGSEVVWRNQPRARSSTSRYALEAGSTRLARKMDTYITSNMAELPKMFSMRGEISANPCMYVHMYIYVFPVAER